MVDVDDGLRVSEKLRRMISDGTTKSMTGVVNFGLSLLVELIGNALKRVFDLFLNSG